MLVTQNIDDYHCMEIKNSKVLPSFTIKDVEGDKKSPIVKNTAFTPFVYEVHGIVKFMHCSVEDHENSSHHSRTFHRVPTLE